MKEYIKRQIKGVGYLVLFAFLFALVFYLYNLPVEAVWYAASLCGLIGFFFLSIDYWRFHKKHLRLEQLKNSIMLGLEGLPEAEELIEEDYIELLRILFLEKEQLERSNERSRMEMMDYYTLWVHQIKTPIAALRLLLQSGDGKSNADLLTELFKVEEYVEMALGYLRIGDMSSDLLLKKISLDEIIKQAVRKYASIFIRKKIQLQYSELNCEVLTDEKWLVFVVEQLLSNALKYTGENGKVSIYMEEAGRKTLVIEDTGMGIYEEDIPRIFEKGFTGYNGHFHKKSTGIGLYLCKRILAKLSHTIQIESLGQCGDKGKNRIGHAGSDKGIDME